MKSIFSVWVIPTPTLLRRPQRLRRPRIRFNEDERWTCRLQKALGEEYLVTEEGLSGRTTVFVDPLHESMDALSVAYALLKSHEVIDLLIIMLARTTSRSAWRKRRLHRRGHGAAAAQGEERGLLGRQGTQHSGGGTACIKDGFHDA